MSLIQTRRVRFQFPASTPHYWLGNNPFKTHLLNSFTLLFPPTEKWSIRVIKRVLKQVSDTHVKDNASCFIKQEGQHASAHMQFWQNLRRQGYAIDAYLHCLEKLLQWFETSFDPVLNLAVLAGFEHLTEYIADFGLRHQFLALAEPELKLLFEWHAAEEIEHKTVAFDVLQNLNTGYWLRMIGLVVAHTYAIAFIILGMLILLKQDKKLFSLSVWFDCIRFLFIKEKFLMGLVVNFTEYFRTDFHPSQSDNTVLYQSTIQRLTALNQVR